MIIEENPRGEIKGFGPEWACGEYGHMEHDYQQCRACRQEYDNRLIINSSLYATGIYGPLD